VLFGIFHRYNEYIEKYYSKGGCMEKILLIIVIIIISGIVLSVMIFNAKQPPTVKENKIVEIYQGNSFGDYSRQDIVILYELKEHLYKLFEISYDDYRSVYNEYYYVGPDMDQRIFQGHVSVIGSANDEIIREKLKLYNFIGLSVEESRMYLLTLEYDFKRLDEIIEWMNQSSFIISISDPIQGYYEDESFIYVKKDIQYYIEESMDWHQIIVTKYYFKEIDGKYKILDDSDRFFDIDPNWTDEEKKTKLEEFHNRFDAVGEVNFSFEFDLNEFCDKFIK